MSSWMSFWDNEELLSHNKCLIIHFYKHNLTELEWVLSSGFCDFWFGRENHLCSLSISTNSMLQNWDVTFLVDFVISGC